MKRLTLFILLIALTLSCSKNTSPIASFVWTPLTGTTDTVFTFDASGSTDAETPGNQLQFRWDWESDGLWDTELLPEPSIKHRFLADATYVVTLQVVDEEGLTDFCKVTVTVNNRNGTFIDLRDGHEYRWIRIHCQTWMAENLAYLPSVSPSEKAAIKEEIYYVYGYEGTNVDSAKSTTSYKTYGALYNWSAAMNGSPGNDKVPSGVQGACPPGWHLPSMNEYVIFTLPMDNYEINMKSVTGWANDGNGDNASEFNALPAGVRSDGNPDDSRHFYGQGSATNFWTTQDYILNMAWMIRLYSSSPGVGSYPYTKQNSGLSVRCIKND